MKDEKNAPRTAVRPAGLLLRRPEPWFFLFAPFILRLLPCFNAFWLDEIWSWQISRVVTSPLQILTNPLAQSDNNHPLNTFWMYLIGDTGNWWLYRIPAFLAGCAAVLLILKMERKFFRWSILTVCLLVGLSFPLITYSSEARGYAPMLLCAVAGYYWLRSKGKKNPILFAAICIIGLLFHLTFLHFFLAAIVWVLAKRQKKELQLFIVPVIALLVYAWVFLRHVHVGGAPEVSLVETSAAAFSLLLGGPMAGPWVYFAAVVALLCIAKALHWLYRQSATESVFFLSVIFFMPGATILLQSLSPDSAPGFHIRYLLVPFTFSLILLSRYFAALLQTPGLGRRAGIAILALVTLGNGYHLGQFLAVGRGDYRAAMQHMAADTPSPAITWSSDNQSNLFRIATIAQYYMRFLPPGSSFRCTADPTWLIFNAVDYQHPIPALRYNSGIYQFDSAYPAYGLSGWSWVLYKKNEIASRSSG